VRVSSPPWFSLSGVVYWSFRSASSPLHCIPLHLIPLHPASSHSNPNNLTLFNSHECIAIQCSRIPLPETHGNASTPRKREPTPGRHLEWPYLRVTKEDVIVTTAELAQLVSLWNVDGVESFL
jgi:hypothetical protein